jgi:hypothetical protein
MERTGGRSFYPDKEGLETIFNLLANEIKGTYLIALYPSEQSKSDGKFYEVKIETNKNYLIRQNRTGYQFVSERK